MRKIESLMVEAVREGLNWQSANTSVQTDLDNVSRVFLHGNHIATIWSDESSGSDYSVQLFDGGHQTKTTKSRLNALLSAFGEQGDRVFAKSFDWFITMNTVQGPTTVPFFSSMRLG